MKLFTKPAFFCFFFVLISACQQETVPTKRQILQDDYTVYSTLIDANLIELNSLWYIKGEKVEFLKNKDFEQINIYPETFPAEENLLSNAYLINVTPELLSSYKEINDEKLELENNFVTKRKIFFFDQITKTRIETEARNGTPYEDLVKRSFPPKTGWMAFSRVGFDSEHKMALVKATLTGYELRPGYGPGALAALYLLVKENEQWFIKGAVRGAEAIKLTPAQCEPKYMNYQWDMGSGGISIIGTENGKCHIRQSREEEGGYETFDCFIPQDLPPIIIFKSGSFYYSTSIFRFCEKPKRGNFLAEQADEFRKSLKRKSK